MKNITIYDIANEAGVSPATVSRVINASAGVSPEKAKKIKEIIEKYQFRPNAIASGLKTKSSKNIGFLVPYITNPFYASHFHEMQLKAKENDYMVFLCNTEDDRSVESKALQSLIDQQVEAIVLIGGRIDELPMSNIHLRELIKINSKVPLILTSKTPEIECVQFVNDEKECMRQVVEHLASKGHKEVALVGGYDGAKPSYNRRRYFLEFLEKYNMQTRDEWMIDSATDYSDGIYVMEQLWQCKHRPTAVCAINDLVALGVLKACYNKGIQVPRDLAVMGCDGIEQAEHSIPGLTSVATDYKAFGEKILTYIMDENHKHKYECIKIPMKLIIREST